jgi:phosphatidylglycerophosphate synthase
MIHAWVFDTDAPLLTAGAQRSPVPACERLAGLTLLRRAILAAWKAGAKEVIVVARDEEAAARWAASEVGLPVPVRVVADAAFAPAAVVGPILVLSAQVLPGRGALERLLTAAEHTGTSTAAVSPSAGCRGPAVLSPDDLARASAGAERASEAVQRTLEASGSADDLPYRRIDSPQALAEADRDLYRGLTSVTDGYVDRVFNRRISRWFTRRVINLPVTPNHVTWLHFSLGLLAAWLFWQGPYAQQIVGAFLFQLSVALDCSDGEIARLKYQFSKFGSWLDVATDNVVTVAIFAAVAKAAAVRLGAPAAAALGVLMVTGVLMCVLVIFTMAKLQDRQRPGEASSLAATNRLSGSDQAVSGRKPTLVDAVINEATSRDFSVLVVAFALIGRLEWLAWLAAVGSHLFWMVFAVIQLSYLRTADAQSR